MYKPTYVYVTYIATTAENLWEALTNGEFTKKYFFHQEVESDWNEGSTITYRMKNDEIAVYGKVITYDPYRQLSFTWNVNGDGTKRESSTFVSFELTQMEDTVKLTLKHHNLVETDYVENEDTFVGLNNGWPAVLSNLKSLLETGSTLPPIVG